MTNLDHPSLRAYELVERGGALSDRIENGKRVHLDQALDLFAQAALLDPSNYAAHYNQGLTLSRLGKWAEAEIPLRRADEIMPDSVAVLSILAQVVANQGRQAEAAELIRRICTRGSGDHDSWITCGIFFLQCGYHGEARDVLIRAAEIFSNDRVVIHYLALAHLGCGHFQDAIHTMRRMKDLAPGKAERWRESQNAAARGRDWLRAGDFREALAEFRRALSHDIDDGEIHRDAEICVRNLFPEAAVSHPEFPIAPLSPAEQEFIELFNMFSCSLTSRNRRTFILDWLGHECQKTPGDMWAYQEIIFETKPDLIVECGTFNGGSALYFASLLELSGKGEIISIDVEDRPGRPTHPRIHYISGSSTAPGVLEQVRLRLPEKGNVMVVLDSDHSRDHVLAELRAYGPLVSKDCYLVVEDGVVNFRPIHNPFYPTDGPTEAIMDFLKESDAFHIDKTRERFLVSVCPNGFLRRI